MLMKNGNENHAERLQGIEQEIGEVRQTLQHAIYHLTGSINRMSDKFELYIDKSAQMVPAKLAMLMFLLGLGGAASLKVLDALVKHFGLAP